MMNCNDFKNNITDIFDRQPDQSLTIEMQKHMKTCASCTSKYDQTKKVFENLNPSISFSISSSGLKQNILNQIKKEEINMETDNSKNFRLKRWHKRAMAVAASIVFIVAVFMLSERSPFVNTAQAAENIMLRSITAMDALRSMFISMDVRSQERENFDVIGEEYDFIEYKFWKQFSGEQPWRIEKPGRIVVWNGEKQFLYLPDISYALTAGREAGFVEWMKLFFEPKSILENEIAFSKKHDAIYKIDKTGDEIILTVSANALGDFHNNYLKNSSILTSDNSRIYIFDKETMLLKSFELFINSNGQSTKVIKINNIAYNIPIDASTFSIQLAPGVEWRALVDPAYIKAFTKISSKQAAKKFFTALAKEDYAFITPIWDVLQITDKEKLEELKSIYGGLEVISIGEPFKSGLYPGEFVPYKIRLKSGEIDSQNLALRNDNPTKTWEVDGGL